MRSRLAASPSPNPVLHVLAAFLGSGLLACQGPADPARTQQLRSGQYGTDGGSTGWGSSYGGSSWAGGDGTTGYASYGATTGTGTTGYGATTSDGTTGYGATTSDGTTGYASFGATTGDGTTGYGGYASYGATTGDGTTGYASFGATTGDGTTGYGGSYSTTGYGSMSVGSGGGSDSTGSGTNTTTASATDTDTDLWYGSYGGTFLTGFTSQAYDNDDCSGPTEEGYSLLSTCDGNVNLDYPSHDQCTDTPETATQSCDAWCFQNGKGGGVCTVEADGPDHCDCERRSDFGTDLEEPGCVAEYAASDKTCAQVPLNHVVATCLPPEAPSLVSTKMQDKRLEGASCSQDPIDEETIDCNAYCDDNYDDPEGGFAIGYCETEESNECGGLAAAKCVCGHLEYAATQTATGLACVQVFWHSDHCEQKAPTPGAQTSSCGVNNTANVLTTYPATACENADIPTETIDCQQMTCPAGKSGECVENVDVTCPNDEKTKGAECQCV